jgi:hypothetical protein
MRLWGTIIVALLIDLVGVLISAWPGSGPPGRQPYRGSVAAAFSAGARTSAAAPASAGAASPDRSGRSEALPPSTPRQRPPSSLRCAAHRRVPPHARGGHAAFP